MPLAEILHVLLLIFLIVCALAVQRTKDLLGAVVIFGAYSFIMAVVWVNLEAPRCSHY